MSLTFQITFHGLDHSDSIERYVRSRAEKLDTFFPQVSTCRVAIESPHKHKHEGRPFRIRIALGVPGDEIVVSHDVGTLAHDDVYAATDAAFDELQRRLQDYARRRRGDVKTHEHVKHGVVTKLFAYEGYGFLVAEGAADEVYFHRNAVLHHGFERMKIGARVRFEEEMGDDGVHATSILVLRRRAKSAPPPSHP